MFRNQKLRILNSTLVPRNQYSEFTKNLYECLSLIIEKVCGVSFGNFIKENVLLPLNLQDSKISATSDGFYKKSLRVEKSGSLCIEKLETNVAPTNTHSTSNKIQLF